MGGGGGKESNVRVCAVGITGAANGASTRHCVCVCLGSSMLPMAKIAVLIIVRSPCVYLVQSPSKK